MALTAQELDSLRFHLGYTNTDADLYSEVSSALSVGSETTAAKAIVAGTIVALTPVSMDGITLGASLVVDVGESAEVVIVQAVTATTFTARFRRAHSVLGFPIGTLRGVTRLRMLLWQAELANSALFDGQVSRTAGLKSIDKGDVEWFEGGQFLKDRVNQYMAIVCAIASLVGLTHKRNCTTAAFPEVWSEELRGW